MYRIITSFPAGLPGAGLLLLRLVLATYLAIEGAAAGPLGEVSVLFAAVTAAGVLTPLVQMALTGIAVMQLAAHAWVAGIASLWSDPQLAAPLAIAIAVSLAMLGPGAYSIDACWFGRRIIVIPPRQRTGALPLSWYAKRPQT